MLERTCQTCGAPFTTTPSQNQRYCSRRCGWDAQKGRPLQRPSSRVERHCLLCGAAFLVFPAHIRKGGGKFCSRSCAAANRFGESRGGTGRRVSGTARARVIARDKTCVACGVWDPRPRCMQVHHIDGDETNRDLSNLILLCVRCHREWHRQEGNGPSMRGRRRQRGRSVTVA